MKKSSGHVGAPYVAGCDTSHDAAKSIVPYLKGLRGLVFRVIRWSGDKGVTCDEAEVTLHQRHQAVSARIRELVQLKVVYITSERRRTRSGRTARVYRVVA